MSSGGAAVEDTGHEGGHFQIIESEIYDFINPVDNVMMTHFISVE